MFFWVLVVVCSLLSVFFYLNGKYYEEYWKKRGVKYYTRNRTFGLFWDFIMKPNQVNFQCISDIYNAYKGEPAVGIGCLFIPGLLVTDPTNAKYVLENDFKSFYDRGFEINEHDFLGSQNIAFTKGVKWKLQRTTFTSLFTTSKLKNMFHSIDDIAREFVEYLKSNPKREESTFFTLKRFGSAAILAALFGMKLESTFDSYFLTEWKVGLKATLGDFVTMVISIIAPSLSRILDLKLFGALEDNFIHFLRLVGSGEGKGKQQHFSTLYEKIKINRILKDDESQLELELTDEMVASNIFFFVGASMQSTVSSIFAVLLSLAQNRNKQEELYEKIDTALKNSNGKLTYETLNEITYLDKVMDEALRRYPAVPYLTRKCTRNTILPVGSIKVDEGTLIVIPTYQHHNDPDYFLNPDCFNPERFSNSSLGHSSLYKPFGRGPRMCLAYRYAKMQVKIVVLHIVKNFTLETIPGSDQIKLSKSIFTIDFSDMSLKLKPR